MGTLIKRKGLFPSVMKKSANNFFDDNIESDLSDYTANNFTVSGGKLSSVNLTVTDTNIEVELAAPEKEVGKMDSLIKREFNYRSFCRLPNL